MNTRFHRVNEYINLDKFLNRYEIGNKKYCRAYDATVNYAKTSFGQRFLD